MARKSKEERGEEEVIPENDARIARIATNKAIDESLNDVWEAIRVESEYGGCSVVAELTERQEDRLVELGYIISGDEDEKTIQW